MTAVESDADLYRMHSGELLRYATVLVGRDDAQDVVANAFARSLASRAWPAVANRRAYLFAAVTNEARNHARGAARRRNREARQPMARPLELDTPRPDVRAAIETLSVRQRAVVYLAYWEDMTDQMAAEHLGISPGAVRRHLGRARERLRELLDE